MGCGPSTIIRHLIPLSRLKKIKYTGVDISKEMLKFAKKNIPSGKFVIGDMSTVELPKESADIIVSLGGLHHSVDKDKTLSHWLQLLKSDGIIMLREPTYEAFKAGKGESPMEEGIKMSELVSFVKEYNLVLESITYFNTGAFHLFNRILIKLGLKGWQKIRSLWYPVIYVDIFLSKYLGFIPYCKGLAFAAIIRKQYVK
jgi:SAM-dependent methyltransferase